jgi:hypothetical protein
MAEKKEKYYKISIRNYEKSGTKYYIIVDDNVKPTPKDLEDIKLYLQCGYILTHKSQSRAAAARERAAKTGFGKNNKKKKAEEKTEE